MALTDTRARRAPHAHDLGVQRSSLRGNGDACVQLNFKVSKAAKWKLDMLATEMGIPKTDVIEQALHALTLQRRPQLAAMTSVVLGGTPVRSRSRGARATTPD